MRVTSNNDQAMLLSCGFEGVGTNRGQPPLAKPAVLRVVAGMSGEVLVTIRADELKAGLRAD